MGATTQEKAAQKRQGRIDATMRRLAEQMVAALESGLEDESWQPPWHSASFATGARNVATGNAYRGGNWLLLALLEASDPETFAGPWGTFAQWKSVDACVGKGSKGTPIMAPRPITVTDKDTGEEKRWLSWRVYWVFAASQVEGWQRPEVPKVDMAELGESGRAFLAAARARFTICEHATPRAYYDLVDDSITLPEPGYFADGATGFAAVMLHELVHLSGAKGRLDRFEPGHGFTGEERAKEELIAELGSAGLGHDLRISTGLRSDHRAYLNSWLTGLQDRPAELWEAATQASKASNWLRETLAPATVQLAA